MRSCSRRHAVSRPALRRRRARARPRRDDVHARRAAGAVGRRASRHLAGNRDPRIAPGLAALADGEWDAAIDTSGYVPRCVEASADAARGPRRALHVRVVDVGLCGREPARASTKRRRSRRSTIPRSEDIAAHYGALKARCEDEVRAAFGDRAFIVRPGLIVGPLDPTDRFGYWVARFACPELLARAAAAAVVPAPPDRVVQFIDARDLASWMLDLVGAAQRTARSTRAAPAGMWTMGDARRAPRRERTRGRQPDRGAWIDDATLLSSTASRRGPGCRCGFPASDAESAGFMHSPARARWRTGLRYSSARARRSTTPRRGFAQRDNSGAWRNVLSAEKEREILATSRHARRHRPRRSRARLPRRSAFAMDPTTNAALLEFALRTAQAAGEAILPHFRAALDVEDKGGRQGLRSR